MSAGKMERISSSLLARHQSPSWRLWKGTWWCEGGEEGSEGGDGDELDVLIGVDCLVS